MLEAGATLDKENNAGQYRWHVGRRSFFGQTTEVFLPPGEHVVQLAVLDSFTGIGRDEVTVTVADSTPQFDFVPPSVVANQCGPIDIGMATATSECDEAPTVTNDAPAEFKAGRTVVTWTADTGSGQATAEQEVVVLLNDDPGCCPAGSNPILGSSDNDVLVGTPEADCILAFGAQDQIYGGGGDDIISAGEGDDQVWGGDGNDVISAAGGQDILYGEAGDDVLSGGTGDDQLYAGDGADLVFGGTGQDLLVCGGGPDRCFGEAGDDHLLGEAGDDLLVGGENNDQCTGGDGFDTVLECVAQDTPESVGEAPFPGDPDYAACDCRPSKCNDCQSGVATCDTIDGCAQILQCVQETSGCNLPHECSATCETGRNSAAVDAARQLASCFGGCD